MKTKRSTSLGFMQVLLVVPLLLGRVRYCLSDPPTIPTSSDDLGYTIEDLVLPEGYFDNKINAIPVVGYLGELIAELQERRGRIFIIVLPLLSASLILRD